MMNDHNLDDLIIGEPEPRGGKSKSLLSLIALVIILVVAGVFLAKLIFGGPEEDRKTETTELTGLVAPKTNTTTHRPIARPDEEIPEELKPITRESLPETSELPPLENVQPVKPKTGKSKPAAAEKAVTESPAEKTEKIIKTVKKPSGSSETKTKKAVAKSVPKKKPAVKSAKKTAPSKLFKKSAAAKKSYYIQIGSFKRKPDQKYFDKISAKGYKPVIVKTGEMIKVRVGPYSSYDEAKSNLPVVKEKLGIDGFVVRKK